MVAAPKLKPPPRPVGAAAVEAGLPKKKFVTEAAKKL